MRENSSSRLGDFICDTEIINIEILKENQIKLKHNIAGRKNSGLCDLKANFINKEVNLLKYYHSSLENG